MFLAFVVWSLVGRSAQAGSWNAGGWGRVAWGFEQCFISPHLARRAFSRSLNSAPLWVVRHLAWTLAPQKGTLEFPESGGKHSLRAYYWRSKRRTSKSWHRLGPLWGDLSQPRDTIDQCLVMSKWLRSQLEWDYFGAIWLSIRKIIAMNETYQMCFSPWVYNDIKPHTHTQLKKYKNMTN